MISKEEVQHIAKLARLELTEQETEKMQKDMSAILDYFDLLKKAKTAKTDIATKASRTVAEVTRRDTVSGQSSSVMNNLVESAPAAKDGYVKVKQILQ